MPKNRKCESGPVTGYVYEQLDNRFFYGCCTLNEVEVKMDLAVT